MRHSQTEYYCESLTTAESAADNLLNMVPSSPCLPLRHPGDLACRAGGSQSQAWHCLGSGGNRAEQEGGPSAGCMENPVIHVVCDCSLAAVSQVASVYSAQIPERALHVFCTVSPHARHARQDRHLCGPSALLCPSGKVLGCGDWCRGKRLRCRLQVPAIITLPLHSAAFLIP